jgi:hypothetical protein
MDTTESDYFPCQKGNCILEHLKLAQSYIME